MGKVGPGCLASPAVEAHGADELVRLSAHSCKTTAGGSEIVHVEKMPG